MALKVAVMGAGSIPFTRRLVRDILTVPELQDTQFAFTDINVRNLRMAAELCAKDTRANHLPVRLTAAWRRCNAPTRPHAGGIAPRHGQLASHKMSYGTQGVTTFTSITQIRRLTRAL